MHRNPGEAGITLIELMVTLSVLAILASVALPALSQFVRDRRLASAAIELRQTLAQARNTAIAQARPVAVCRSSDGAACLTTGVADWRVGWITFVDGDGDATRDASEALLGVNQPLATSVAVRGSASVADYVLYSGTGLAVSAGGGNPVSGSFAICDDRGVGHARGIALTAGGATASTLPQSCTPS